MKGEFKLIKSAERIAIEDRRPVYAAIMFTDRDEENRVRHRVVAEVVVEKHIPILEELMLRVNQ